MKIRDNRIDEKRKSKILKNRVFNGKINTVVPKDDNSEDHWDWFQRNIVYRGLPFSFNVGIFEYVIPQISKFTLMEIEDQLSRGDLHAYIIDNAIPHNKYAKLFKNRKKDILEKNTPADFLTGVISEFLLLCSSYKKKMWDIKINGIIKRGLKARLTLSQRQNQLENTRILKHIGTDIFGLR